MDIFSYIFFYLRFQTLELITALCADVTAIASTINSTCNRVPELRPILIRVIIPIFMIPLRPLLNQNSHFIISPAMARARRTNNRVIARSKRRHFVIELKLKRKGKRKTSLYIYKFLSKKFSNYSFNFSSKKKFQIITLGKMFNYSFEFYFAKNSFNILQKKIYLNFLIKKCSITHSNFISRKIHSIYFGKKFIRILFCKKILRLFIDFMMSHFTRNILLIEICHAKFFNFRIKIIFRDKILYQFNKFNQKFLFK